MEELIHVSFGKGYLYKGVTLEWHYWCGPIILNRHTEQERNYKNISLRVWSIVNKFARLSAEDKQLYKIY